MFKKPVDLYDRPEGRLWPGEGHWQMFRKTPEKCSEALRDVVSNAANQVRFSTSSNITGHIGDKSVATQPAQKKKPEHWILTVAVTSTLKLYTHSNTKMATVKKHFKWMKKLYTKDLWLECLICHYHTIKNRPCVPHWVSMTITARGEGRD